jgi:ABC-type nickel/cobalt efflux system permease component RcnA
VLFALGLGAVHALAPGHGKTVMAAYLVGRRGDRRLALLLGGTVAATHTLAVLVLGTIVSASSTVAPERAYPALGVVSGVLFASVGVSLLVRARRHSHHHDHDHHDDDHHHHHHHDDVPAPGWRGIVLPGLAGGLVPSPSALLVYLAGLALGRAWFGVALVVTYGLGIAASLVVAGYLLVRVRDRLVARGVTLVERAAVRVPVVSAVLVVLGGTGIAVRAATGI